MRPVPLPSWMAEYVSEVPEVISSIRAHPPGVPPAVESIPQINVSMMCSEPLARIIRDIQETGFQHWGFVIYRCAYASNLQWESYLEFFKARLKQDLEHLELDTLPWQYLEWTIIEDPASLDGATKQNVRDHFSNWVAEKAADGSQPDFCKIGICDMARFKYCIYVDQKCLDTVDQYETWVQAGAKGVTKAVVCAILDKDYKPTGRGKRGFQSIEGCVRENTGWMYTEVGCTAGLYDKFSSSRMGEWDYKRPPEVWPLEDPMPFES
ncbi:hypothetical protein AK830_g248 [Neonectria ditissima]|uniref:Uncharacterized protein n=1 Tax=Neonectria ditissima TaxID=78410 RepID=A0A0N8H933_9HYPO|nr:hypothetical protein AK830_g248 [Neonectria ditissima]